MVKFHKRKSISNLLLERLKSNLLNWIFRFPTAYVHIVFLIKNMNFKFRKNHVWCIKMELNELEI